MSGVKQTGGIASFHDGLGPGGGPPYTVNTDQLIEATPAASQEQIRHSDLEPKSVMQGNHEQRRKRAAEQQEMERKYGRTGEEVPRGDVDPLAPGYYGEYHGLASAPVGQQGYGLPLPRSGNEVPFSYYGTGREPSGYEYGPPPPDYRHTNGCGQNQPAVGGAYSTFPGRSYGHPPAAPGYGYYGQGAYPVQMHAPAPAQQYPMQYYQPYCPPRNNVYRGYPGQEAEAAQYYGYAPVSYPGQY